MDENPSQCPVCDGPMKDWQSASPFEWQPIETAPKDGTKVLLTGPHDANGQYMEVCGYWRDRFPVVWMDGHGEPTHWMPLPNLPKAHATAEAPIPPEPVAVLRYDRSPGNENDMPKVVSCKWLPDGEYEVFLSGPTLSPSR